MLTVTVSPSSALPQTGTRMPCWSTAPSEKSAYGFTVAHAACPDTAACPAARRKIALWIGFISCLIIVESPAPSRHPWLACSQSLIEPPAAPVITGQQRIRRLYAKDLYRVERMAGTLRFVDERSLDM